MKFKDYLMKEEGNILKKLKDIKTKGGKWFGVLKSGKEIPIPDDIAETFMSRKTGHKHVKEDSKYTEKKEWFIKKYGKMKGLEKYRGWVQSWEKTKNIYEPKKEHLKR